ncbi:hypothetical protein DL768_009174 [Monosporascus sp. mg162]|nr:hypothetical protein DL768_009174 [Monosporascus sp. mg162]
MLSGRVNKSRIEIPLPSKPRPYRPGDGPTLAPITLALKRDTDAFIVDKRVLPGEPIHGELKLEMYYVVGWPDLPAGRVVINAKHIYDYVSPRTLEDFEYKLTIEREEEQERQETEEAKRRTETAAKAAASSTIATPKTPKEPTLTVKGKKRGRPSKADLLARSVAQQTSVDENVEVPLPPMSTSGPSLSTPQKKLATATLATVDTDDAEGIDEREEEAADIEDDSDTAIFNQLYLEATAFGKSREASIQEVREDEIPPKLQVAPPQKPINGKPGLSTPSRPRPQHQTSQTGPASHSKSVPTQKTTLQHYGFTPAGRSSRIWPSPSPKPAHGTVKADPDIPLETPTTSKSSRKRKRVVSDEPLWEVERLEGDKTEEVDGMQTRFFKVLWKGDWAPDENPTWEPEENIPRKLIKMYLRHKVGKSDARSPSVKGSHTPKAKHPSPPVRKYSSVAEAFEGVADEEPSRVRRPARNISAEVKVGDDDDGEEQLIVTEEEQQRRSGLTSPSTPASVALITS